MEVIVNREDLLPALNRVCGVVEKRQTLPMLGNILVIAGNDEVEMTGTDLEVEVASSCRAEVVTAGKTTLPARKLQDIVRNLGAGSEIRLVVEEGKCKLRSGRGRYVLGILDAEDFPARLEREEEKIAIRVREKDLKVLLEKTAFAMAQQDVRYYLNGLLIEFKGKGVRGVATDGHRLARYDLILGQDCNNDCAVIVPYKAVGEIRRNLGTQDEDIDIAVTDRLIEMRSRYVGVRSKLVDGKYPDYERVMPVILSNNATVDKEALKRSLARTAILSNEKYRGVKIGFGRGVMRLTAHNPEQEEAIEELELAYEGEERTIGFNVAYLSDVLAAVDTESVEVMFEDENSSSVWRGLGKENEAFVVMPMRL